MARLFLRKKRKIIINTLHNFRISVWCSLCLTANTYDKKSQQSIVTVLKPITNCLQFGSWKQLIECVYGSINIYEMFGPTFLVAEFPDLKFGMLTITSFFGPGAPSCCRFLVMVTWPFGGLNLSTTCSFFSEEITFDEWFNFWSENYNT